MRYVPRVYTEQSDRPWLDVDLELVYDEAVLSRGRGPTIVASTYRATIKKRMIEQATANGW